MWHMYISPKIKKNVIMIIEWESVQANENERTSQWMICPYLLPEHLSWQLGEMMDVYNIKTLWFFLIH